MSTVTDTPFSVDHETVGEYNRQHFNATITVHKVFSSAQTTESTGYPTMAPSSSIEPSSTAKLFNEKYIIFQNTEDTQSTTMIRKRSITTNSETRTSNMPNEISSSSSDNYNSRMTTSDQLSTRNSQSDDSYMNYDPESIKTTKDMPRLTVDCPKPIQVCSTLECKKSAQRILALIDHSVDPCDDFYKYACGGRPATKMDGIVGLLSGYIVDSVWFLMCANEINYRFNKIRRSHTISTVR